MQEHSAFSGKKLRLDLMILIVSNAQDSNLMNNIEGARFNKNVFLPFVTE
jgi:hypothetical protein